MMKVGMLMSVCLSLASPAWAEDWSVKNDKGLLIHKLASGDIALTVVCDPNGAYQPPEVFMMVEENGRKLEAGQLAVSRDGETARLNIVGAAIVARTDAGSWNKALGWLMDGGAVGFSTGNVEASVPAGAVFKNTCLIK